MFTGSSAFPLEYVETQLFINIAASWHALSYVFKPILLFEFLICIILDYRGLRLRVFASCGVLETRLSF